MIIINNKQDCCGCGACSQICKKKCITMTQDCEGFLYPNVDLNLCTNCGLCEKVCPIIHQYEPKTSPIISYAFQSSNRELIENSSSGGAFTILSQWVIEQNGVVFGARFDSDWNVVHDYTETLSGLSRFRGSKYLQSNINNTYNLAKDFLKNGRIVLFSGTPCQIAGLKHFLQRDDKNLITVDFVCHSCPSPKVWQKYLLETSRKFNFKDIKRVSFRSKKNGWNNYSIEIQGDKFTYLKPNKKDWFMRGFLSNLFVRPSCSKCPARNYKSDSDFTIGDFWGIEKYHLEHFDNRGMSLILVNSHKAEQLLAKMHIKIDDTFFKVTYDEVEPYALHASITRSTQAHNNREYFFRNLTHTNNISFLIFQSLWYSELKGKLYRIYKLLFHT